VEVIVPGAKIVVRLTSTLVAGSPSSGEKLIGLAK
jgi:hypothetical protein